MQKNIAIIIGSGRSGTSLLTNILLSMGMQGSEEYLPANHSNPEGYFEDADIIDVHKEIFNEFSMSVYAPIVEEFFEKEELQKYAATLRNIVGKKVEASKGVWGFKDPRTTSLMPFWNEKILVPLQLTPKYILSIRHPSSVVISMGKLNIDNKLAELVWLVRTCDALYYSNGACFIVHYEDWFTDKARQLALDLGEFIGLESRDENSHLNELLSDVVKKSLNRSGEEAYELQNPFVKKLYEELKNCNGQTFDHARIMPLVIECRKVVRSFSPWVSLVAKRQKTREKSSFDNTSLIKEMNKYLQKIQEYKVDNEELNEQVKKFVNDNGANKSERILEIKIQKYEEELERNKFKIQKYEKELERNKIKIQKHEKEFKNIKSSGSYKLGQMLVQALKRPGINTLLLPYHLVRLTISKLLKNTSKHNGEKDAI